MDVWCASNHLLSLQGWLTALKCLRKPVRAASADQLKPGELMNELWLPVVGYEGLYEVSDQGRVRSLDRRVENGTRLQFWKGRLLFTNIWGSYLKVVLCRNGRMKNFHIHVLVAEAFHGLRPEGLVVNHIDENKLNNNAANLEWVTYKQNLNHSKAAYLAALPRGSRHGRSKLNESQVRAIRLDNRSNVAVAKEYGVTDGTVSHIRTRTTWKHIN